MAQLASRPLTEIRVREVLAFLSAPGEASPSAKHPALVRDYLRMMEIHGATASLGELVGQVPEGANLNVARIAALRAQVCAGAHAEPAPVAPDEQAAVLACSAEIDAALRRLQQRF